MNCRGKINCRLTIDRSNWLMEWISTSENEDQFTSPCPWNTKSLKIFKDFIFCKLSVMHYHVTSINCYRHRAYGEKCLTYWREILLTDISPSKPLFTVTLCCCPRGKSLSLSSRSNLQVIVLAPQVLVLEPKVLDLEP